MSKLAIDKALQELCMDAASVNTENLKLILSENAGTEFGIRYGFSEINNADEYRKCLPVMDYSGFAPYIQKMMQGMENQLTVYPVVSYCQTSGTQGKPKYIPVSSVALERYSNYFERYKNAVFQKQGGKRFLVNAFRTDLSRPIEPVSLFSEIYFRFLYEKGLFKTEEFIGGTDTIFTCGKEDADIFYAKLWTSFLEEDITMLESQFLYELLCFFGYMEENWQNVLRDIKNHNIPPEISLSPKIREELLHMEVSEERLAAVEEECRKGFDNIAGRLWKNLCQASGVGNRAYHTETAALDRYLGSISRYYLCYCASECYLGAPLYENEFGYVLIPQNAFFEFLPYNTVKCGEEKTYLPSELETGKLYEPVITNFSGLYRYRLGDVVKITGFFGESPVMEFMFRRNQALNIVGEKIDLQQLEDAVYSLREYGILVQQYCVGVSMERIPGRYFVAMSVEKGKGTADREKTADLFDEALAKRNPDYADLRKLKQLGRPEVVFFEGHNYTKFLESQGMSKNHGHNKPKHIFSEEIVEEEWKKQIICQKQSAINQG